MSERQVTAVVLLSRSTTLTSLETTAAALAAQTRPPNRTLVMVPAGLSPQVQEAVRRFADGFGPDAVHSLSDTVGRAGAVREALEVIGSAGDAVETVHSPVTTEGGTTARSSGSQGGRRARDIDMEALERARTQEAERLARVPERLRRRRRDTGRRASGSDSWLWFLTEQTAPGKDALAELLSTVAVSPTTAAVGPKRLRMREDLEGSPP